MKTTMNLPDILYRKVKTRAAREGRTVRDVTVELYEKWLAGPSTAKEPLDGKQWLRQWRALGKKISASLPPGTDLQAELQEQRNHRFEAP
jgi:hypothetical protein